jgi:hypothetical protein
VRRSRAESRPRLAGLLVLAAACLVACPSPTLVGPPAALAARPIEATGPWRHDPSGFRFPEGFGKFQRVAITQYDEEGRNVSVGYNLDEDLKLVLTLYVRPPARSPSGEPLSFEDEFRSEHAAIASHHQVARETAPWEVPTTRNQESSPGRAMGFRYPETFAGASRDVTSLLYLFQYDGWIVKYRITFPAVQEQNAFLVAQVFVAGFRWRGSD